ncbi:MAG: ATP-binding cassette domain-containing protein [Clostridiaceae bacterium]|nr:ATP-binding cassette domain-containing protein [Clostridiaceae bacterium]
MEIIIDALVKNYGKKQVLNIGGLHIKKSSFLGIIGPNGAGKSTLVKILSALDKPSFGKITYNGSYLNATVAKKMTMVFQKPYLMRTTVFNNIAYPLVIRKFSKEIINNKVNTLMKELDIEDIKDQKAWTLSGGEAQKVALARAIIFEPSLLLLDEPTASIDPASLLLMEGAIKKFHENHSPTIIMVTHNIQQANRLCNKLAFMHQGKIIAYDKTSAIINSPQHPSVRNFIKGEIII